MPQMNIIQSVNSALDIILEKDSKVCIFGEDVGYFGGVFRCTDGLQAKYGKHRVFDSPLSEGGIVSTAIGMGINGLRPVAEIQFSDYIFPAFDQLTNELAKLRYRSGGEYWAPVTVRTPCGGGIRGGHYHSQSPEAYFTHTPGLKVVMPSNPYDTKGLLISAIEDDDPVISPVVRDNLKKDLKDSIVEVFRQLNFPTNIDFLELWYNIYHDNQGQEKHSHLSEVGSPLPLWSGVYYNKNASPTQFFRSDKLYQTQLFEGYKQSGLAPCLAESGEFPVEDGDILLFPPYLEHSVESKPQHKDSMRMTFSFNIALKP